MEIFLYGIELGEIIYIKNCEYNKENDDIH